MSTEITVVVGADSLLKRDQSTRNARRRDRLDSEALRDQVKVKAQEEDKSKGFNNKKDEYDPSRDPAAHARKKDVSVGGFTTCNIRQVYHKEGKIQTTGQFGNVGYIYSGGKFMDIFIKAIKPDGNFGNEIEINIPRNRLDPMFYVDQSDLNVVLLDQFRLFYPTDPSNPPYFTSSWRQAPARTVMQGTLTYSLQYQNGNVQQYGFFGWHPFFGPNQDYEIGRPNSFKRQEDGTWKPYRYGNNSFSDIPDQFLTDQSGQFDHYISLGHFFDGPYENYSPYNYNRLLSCGDEDDIQNALGRPGYGDPGYQIYMLPLNENHSYVVILYTDVEVSYRGFAHYFGTMETRIDLEGQHPDYEQFSGEYKALGSRRHLEKPEYFYPPCFETNDNSTQLTGQALNQMQQIKIVELKDGVATLIPDDQISVPLKQKFKVMMPLTDDIQQPISNRDPIFEGSGRDVKWSWSYNMDRGAMVSSTTATSDSQVLKETVIDWVSFLQLEYVDYNSSGIWGSEYRVNQARERSLAKGYGLGFLETSNHFDSIYVENYGYPFKAESTYLANDTIFTPAIYSYLGLVATPSTDYQVVGEGLNIDAEAAPKRFISIDYDTRNISSVELSGPNSVLLPVDSSFVSKPQEIPIFRRATHYAWNWDNPEFCWQRLIDMGFTAAMIGPKPENPTDE